MSISYCGECEQIIEGDFVILNGERHCVWCGAEASELPEDDPRRDR